MRNGRESHWQLIVVLDCLEDKNENELIVLKLLAWRGMDYHWNWMQSAIKMKAMITVKAPVKRYDKIGLKNQPRYSRKDQILHFKPEFTWDKLERKKFCKKKLLPVRIELRTFCNLFWYPAYCAKLIYVTWDIFNKSFFPVPFHFWDMDNF